MRIKLGIPLELKEISSAVGGALGSNNNNIIEYITIDSRMMKRGDLFVAIKGKKHNGESFIYAAKKNGCITLSNNKEEGDVYVDNTISALLNLSSYYITKLHKVIHRIGITGSVGKTTTKEFLKTILSAKYKVHANEGNLNNDIGMSLSILSCPEDAEIMIMEMGMNHEGEISALSKCLRPSIAIITNVGTAHIGNLKSRKAIANAKLEITDGMSGGAVIVPHDETLLKSVKGRRTYSTSNHSANYFLSLDRGCNLKAYHNGFYLCKFPLRIQEKHIHKCLAAAIGAAVSTGFTPSELSVGISGVSADITRQRIISVNNVHFYTDYYNASLESVKACIEYVRDLKHYTRKSLVLGDVLELGEHSETIHRKIGALVNHGDFHNLFLFGSAAESIGKEAISRGFPAERVFHNTDTKRPDITASQVIKCSVPGEIILVKASRAMKMERIMEQIKLQSEILG